MSRLLLGSIAASVGDVAQLVRGVTYKKGDALAESSPGYVAVVRATNIVDGHLTTDNGLVFVPERLVKPEQRLRAGDIVLTTSSGSSSSVGRSAFVNEDWGGAFGAFCAVLRPSDRVEAKYLAYYVTTETVRRRWSELAAGTNINNLKRRDVEATPVPIPPLLEQRRIVEAIEEQFSRLDAAQESLRRTRELVIRYRIAAVIEHLRGPWPEVPLSKLARTGSGGTPRRSNPGYFGGSIPWVKSGELGDGVVTSTEETLSEAGLSESSAKVYPRGTLLIAMYGATVGKLGLLEIESAAINQAICAIQPIDPTLSEYLWWVLRAQRSALIASGKGGAQSNISQEIVRSLTVPLPPSRKRAEIVSRLQREESVTEALLVEVEAGQRRARRLRAAILRDAFVGRLAPQDRIGAASEVAEKLMA